MALQRMEEGIAAHYIEPLYLISVPNIQDEVEEICGLRQLVRSSSAIDRNPPIVKVFEFKV